MNLEFTGMARIKTITTGYVIMALALFAIQVLRFFMTLAVAEFAVMGIFALAWALILLGFLRLSGKGYQFRRGLVVSVVGLVFIALELFFALRGERAGMGTAIFIDVQVLFCSYGALVALLYTYSKALKGYGEYVGQVSPTVAGKYPHTVAIVTAVLLVVLVALPVMLMLPTLVGFIGTLVLAALGLAAQIYVCKLLLDGYDEIARSRRGRGHGAKRVERPLAQGGSAHGRTAI